MYLKTLPVVCISLLTARVKCDDKEIINTLYNGNLDEVKRAMSKCEDVDFAPLGGDEYSTPLIIIVTRRRRDMAEYLLYTLNVDINGTDSAGFTALMHAIMRGSMEMFEFLLSRGSDVLLQSSNGDTALHLATWTRTDMTKMIIDHCIVNGYHKSAVNMKNAKKQTPLMAMLRMSRTIPKSSRDTHVAITLIKAGADVDCGDNYRTPLQVASLSGKYEVVAVLLEAGAEVNKEYEDTTALDVVLYDVRIMLRSSSYLGPSIRKVVILLLEYGARVHPNYYDILLTIFRQNIGTAKYRSGRMSSRVGESSRRLPLATALKLYVMEGGNLPDFPERVRYCYENGAYAFYIAFKSCGRSDADFDGEVATCKEVACSTLFRGSYLELLPTDLVLDIVEYREETARKVRRLAASAAAARTLSPDMSQQEFVRGMRDFSLISRI